MAPADSDAISLRPLGRNLARLREAKGLSQRELALAVAATERTVRRWEAGEGGEWGVLTALRIARALDVSVQGLLAPEEPARVRGTSMFFVSPPRLKRMRAARTAPQLAALLVTRPAVGIELTPDDVQVSKDELEAMQQDYDQAFDKQVGQLTSPLLGDLLSQLRQIG